MACLYRTLYIDLISAKDLKKVNLLTKMDVYATVSLTGDSSNSKQKVKTTVDSGSGSNPTWNFPIKFTVDETLVQQNRLSLVFNLKCKRILGDKDIGKVYAPVKELFDLSGNYNGSNSMQYVVCQVREPSGKPKGTLMFSYRFGKISVELDPTALKKAPVVGSSSVPVGNNFRKQAYGPFRGFAPPRYCYLHQRHKKHNFGLGLGLGAGLLGGLLIGDLVSDTTTYDDGYDAAAYDAGYDAGFYDGSDTATYDTGYDAAAYDAGYDAGFYDGSDAAAYDFGYDGGFCDGGF